MTVQKSEVRPGAYYDSIVLMQLQAALAKLEGVEDCGVAMATEANRALLAASGLWPEDAAAGPDDLLIVVEAQDEAAAEKALAQVDALLERRSRAADADYRPKSLEAAVTTLPAARWALVSVPGRFAAGVARRALELERHVFLYSDNVSLDDEKQLKALAKERGLLLMGPDCGTAVVGGVGLGFANRVRRGSVGLVGATGTGLQAVACRLHDLGAGVSHALGTGGRDLTAEVGGTTALQALDLLARDASTRVVVLVSKPPAPAVAARLLAAARCCGKPVVVHFLGQAPPARRLGTLHFAASLGDAADIAARIAGDPPAVAPALAAAEEGSSGYVRGLFSGGTLALEAVLALRGFLAPLYSNLALSGVEPLEDPTTSHAHAIVDLGDDALTVGRLHPMIDPELLLRRFAAEAADPAVSTLLLDVVLGDGAAADPAARLAPAIAKARHERDDLDVVAIVVGTDEDPQDAAVQIDTLEKAGARVFRDAMAAVDDLLARRPPAASGGSAVPVSLEVLEEEFAAVNVGLESFYDSLQRQDAEALHVDWRPPAGGKEKLMSILEKMKR